MPDEYRFFVDGRIPVLKLHGEPRPAPVVIVLHGLGANAETHHAELSALAHGGLSALGVDAPHHGARRDGWIEERERLGASEAHVRLLHGVLESAHDVRRVIDHLVDEGHGPIGLAGISFGAYTALTVAAWDERVQATVSILGSPDWAPRHAPFSDELRELMRHAPVHRPWDCARHPLLLLNAGRDDVVPPQGSQAFAQTLWDHHPDLRPHVGYVEYPESDHMMRPQDWGDVWHRTLDFFRHTLFR